MINTSREGLEERIRELESRLLESQQECRSLRENESRYKAFFRSANDAVFLIKDLCVIDCNDKVADIIGAKREDLIGRSVLDLSTPEQPDGETSVRAAETRIRAALQGRPQYFEWTHLRISTGDVLISWVKLSRVEYKGEAILQAIVRDVTYQKTIEQALRESEHRYHHILQQMIAGAALHEMILDEQGNPCDYRFLQVNPAFEKMTGMKAEDVVGKRALEIMPDLEPFWIERFGRVALTGQPVRFEHYTKPLNRYFDVTAFCPAARQFIAIFYDVSERKRAESALRESEERYRGLFENNQSAILLLDPESLEIVDANKAAVDFYGYSEQELLSMYLWQLGDASKEDLAKRRESFMSQGINRQIQTHRLRDGGARTVETYCGPLKLNGRNLRYAIIHDVTERVEAETALRERKVWLKTILETIQTGIVVVDTETRKIVDVNPVAARLIGGTREEIIGRVCHQYICPSRRGECPICDLGETVINAECVMLTQEGQEIPVMKTVAKMTLEGREHLVGSFIDISEQKKAESARKELEHHLRQAQKMEAIGTIAGGIAHDFNNILTAILLNAEVMEKRISESEDLLSCVRRIEKAAGRGRDLVKQILTFSRRQEERQEPVAVKLIVKEVIKLLQSTLPKTIQIVYNLDANVCCVMADPSQIHQVLMNLCTNAAQAMGRKGGTLSIEMRNLRSQARGCTKSQGDNSLEISISDTGAGIPSENLSRIFDPYFTTKPPGQGTGLGLSVVHGIVHSIGGIIGVESNPGQGTLFRIVLPVCPEITLEAPPLAEFPKCNPKRILLVDDEVDIVQVCDRILTSQGHRVKPCSNPLSALQSFQQTPEEFDVVITDHMMPGMTGIELTQNLLCIRPEIPIILCTGYIDEVSEIHSRNYGLRKIIMKPVSGYDLALALNEVFDKENPIPIN